MSYLTIWGRYKNNPPEKIDHATSKTSAHYLVVEYALAFGKDWTIWAGRKADEPPDPTRHGIASNQERRS